MSPLQRYVVEGSSMAPGFLPGDRLLALRWGRIQRGDVVVLHDPEEPCRKLLKRVAALPGEEALGWRLGAQEYAVLGDYQEASRDSRSLGPVPRRAILGQVWFRYWPPERAGRVRRSHRNEKPPS